MKTIGDSLNNIAKSLAENEDKLLMDFLKNILSYEEESITRLPGSFPVKYICVDGKRRYIIETCATNDKICQTGRMI